MSRMAAIRAVFLPSVLAKFASVGLITTVVTFALIVGLKGAVGASDAVANFLGYVAGLALSFVLNKLWTFQHSITAWRAAGRFLLVFGVAYTINLAVVLGLIKFGCVPYLAHLLGMPCYTVMFYLGCRLYAFKQNSVVPLA